MTTIGSLILTKTAGIAVVTLNRPEKRNALNGEVVTSFKKMFTILAEDDSVRVVVIHANGEHFCAGADIKWMQEIGAEKSQDMNYEDAQALAGMLYQLYNFAKPIIVLTHGATLGGGMGIVATCDIAIASHDAVFGLPEVKIGVAPSTVSPYVIAAMGERAAHYYFLTGERFNAEKAERIGFIHATVTLDSLMNTGMTLAKHLLQNGPHAMVAAKHLLRVVGKEKISENLVHKTAEHLSKLRATDEAKEGLQAFLEKRIPQWS